MRFTPLACLLAICATSLLVLATPVPALACGGLFCSAAQPVNQTAERIIFAHNGDGTLTAVVEVAYEGPAERFSWLIPVPGVPEMGVSSTRVFDNLQFATDPTYSLRTRIEGQCRQPTPSTGGDRGADFTADSSDGAEGDASSGSPPVVVVAEGRAGPYDYEVIRVDPEREDAAEVAVVWLEENGYDLTALGPEVLRPYLEAGMNFVAIRLTKSETVGSIRPLMMTYASERPMIPIRPTAVAAENDMGVLVWILGAERAVPINYRTVVLNDLLIDWFSPNTRYRQLVSEAVDEAGGQAFVTEYSDRARNLRNRVFSNSMALTFRRFEAAAETDPFLNLLVRSRDWSSWDGYEAALVETLAIQPDESLSEAMSCAVCLLYSADSRCLCETWEERVGSGSPDALVEAIERHVVEPVRSVQTLIDEADTVTRLFTVLSPFEMTVDPVFAFNPDASRVSNRHEGTRTIACSPDVLLADAPWTASIEATGGAAEWTLHGSATRWPTSLADGDLPRARRIVQYADVGPPARVTNNDRRIRRWLSGDAVDPTTPVLDMGRDIDSGGAADADSRPDTAPDIPPDAQVDTQLDTQVEPRSDLGATDSDRSEDAGDSVPDGGGDGSEESAGVSAEEDVAAGCAVGSRRGDRRSGRLSWLVWPVALLLWRKIHRSRRANGESV